MKSLYALAATVTVSAALLSGCHGTSESADNISTITIGATGQSYPSSFRQDGKLTGFDVDVAQTIADSLHYKVTWVTADFSGLMGQLEAKKLDTIANVVAINPARQERYNFSAPYSYFESQLVTHKDNVNINTIEDLKGKNVAAVLGSAQLTKLNKLCADGSAHIRTYETRDAAMADTVKNQVAGYINSRPILLATIRHNHLPFKLVGEPFMPETIAFPFQKNARGDRLREQFSAELERMRADGRLKAISEKYYGEDITYAK